MGLFDGMAKYEALIPEARNALQACFEQLKCIWSSTYATWEESKKQREILEYQFGRVEEPAAKDQGRIVPRNFTALPEIWEGPFTATPQTPMLTINIEEKLGRLASSGFYANLGDDVFKVILHGMNDKTVEHRVLPGTTIQLSCFIAKITIIPQDGQPADYQVYVQ
ncbi:hypothetical protein [Deinococcus cellulosilyticus]|uniref:Uncharacterized protein n=1 Tax=Deinococcus cellulosilyticus (strain DSM 18568 / NBRC 106333 / KACC 11606 / 5516J-15) TaxID=1223518 RepID=A0A511MXK0_DEIC1|nr:hypothetical protein [Deinococcus cellulosilyticus]GEM45303.1 hypothetical protein DC3_09380 [Deinococcus cellulosilyticus NBRC 106333 = KACC 11606]